MMNEMVNDKTIIGFGNSNIASSNIASSNNCLLLAWL